MSIPVAVRPYQPADEARVVDLLNLVLGSGRAFERSQAFFRWKHLMNPFGPSLMLVAGGEELVGLRAFLRWRFRVRGAIVSAVRAVDTATHPAYQRMGVFSELTRASIDHARAEGIQFVFNTPNRFSLPGYLKLGWQFVGRTTVMVRLLRPLRAVAALLARPTPDDAVLAEEDGGQPVDALLDAAESLDALLARDDGYLADGIRTARSAAYLRWRYASAPSLKYRAVWEGKGEVKAAAIYRRSVRKGLTELALAELFFEDFHRGRSVVRRMLAEAPADYAVAHCTAPLPHRRVLASLGFVAIPRVGPNFTIRVLNERLECDPALARNWRLSLGDLEVF